MPTDELPLVPGVTDTARDTEPLPVRLAAFLNQRDNGSQDDLAAAMTKLEAAFAKEDNERVKDRIAAALMMLKNGKRLSGSET